MKDKKMIFLAGGGTGGHAFPIMAMAQALCDRFSILWIGARAHIEERLAAQSGTIFYGFELMPVRFGRFSRRIQALSYAFRALLGSLNLMLRHRPKLVVCFGGYASFPVGLAAVLTGRRLVIHEQNSVFGMANLLLLPFAHRIFLGIPLAQKRYFWQKFKPLQRRIERRLVFSGNPTVLPELDSKRFLSRGPRIRMMLMGGSGGAQALNEWMVSFYVALCRLLPEDRRPLLWHQCGTHQFNRTRDLYEASGIRVFQDIQSAEAEGGVCLTGFVFPSSLMYEWADVAFTRAGALSLCELVRSGLPGFIVPLPSSADNHQYYNALNLTRASGAYQLVLQSELSTLRPEDLMALLSERAKLLERSRLVEEARGYFGESSLEAKLSASLS